MNWLWVALGSALGGVGRYALAAVVDARFATAFPWGTLAVNLLGCAAIGWLAVFSERLLLGEGARLFLMVGLLGGFTTFSAFSLQTLMLARSGAWLPAAAYVLASIALCLVGVGAGHALGTLWAPRV